MLHHVVVVSTNNAELFVRSDQLTKHNVPIAPSMVPHTITHTRRNVPQVLPLHLLCNLTLQPLAALIVHP
jgi:hypothetical protein